MSNLAANSKHRFGSIFAGIIFRGQKSDFAIFAVIFIREHFYVYGIQPSMTMLLNYVHHNQMLKSPPQECDTRHYILKHPAPKKDRIMTLHHSSHNIQ